MIKKILILCFSVILSAGYTQDFQEVLIGTASNQASTDRFGFAVDISGDYAVIGAPYKSINSNTNLGQVYVFKKTNGTWSEIQKISSSSANDNNRFGYSVAIDGEYMVVGEPYEYVGQVNSGAIHVYKLNASNTFSFEKRIGGSSGEQFGYAVDIIDLGNDDAMAVGGAPQYNNGQGHVRTYFRRSGLGGSNWTQGITIASSNVTAGGELGTSVAASTTSIIAGAPKHNASVNALSASVSKAGAAFVFDIQKSFINSVNYNYSSQERHFITHTSPVKDDYFGRAVGINDDGDSWAVGVPYRDYSATLQDNGEVVIFTEINGSYQRQAIDNNTSTPILNGHNDGLFGLNLDMKNDQLLIGASKSFTNKGQCSYFEKDPTETDVTKAWKLKQTFGASDQANNNLFGYSMGIDGDQMIVGAYGFSNNTGKLYVLERDGGNVASLFSSPIVNSINVYPNPVQDVLHIEKKGEIQTLKIFSSAGELVLEKNEEHLDVSILDPGVYLLHVTTYEGVFQQCFVKH